MVDDAAAIVIMLAPEPKRATQALPPPPAACVASISNGVANSPEAKAARDKLASLPYQNFFCHLQLVHIPEHCWLGVASVSLYRAAASLLTCVCVMSSRCP